MFGEESLFFITTVKLDNKNRMSIPSKTKIEPHEKIILFDNEDYISIYSDSYVDKFCDNLVKARLKAISRNDTNEALKLNYQLKYYNLFILAKLKVDNQRRIVLSKNIKDRFEYQNSIILQGEYDHINIFRNEDEFNNYKTKIKEKRS